MGDKDVKTYIVGGYVRDQLLRDAGQSIPESDRDWVVVGARPEDMIEAGFLPVGKDFPVFLHPKTHEEYALARTERKTAPGYHGFVFHADPSVTLEDDLRRRDLTVNAIAMDDDGHLIDPYGGEADLKTRIFRHVSPAFSEDPVRLLRVARLRSKLPGFSIAPETLQLMRDMVTSGEADHLVAERVFKEMERALMSAHPSAFLETVAAIGLTKRVLVGLPTGHETCGLLDRAAQSQLDLESRMALLAIEATFDSTFLKTLERLRVPKSVSDFVGMCERVGGALPAVSTLKDCAPLLETLDVLRRPERFMRLEALTRFLGGDTTRWEAARTRWQSVDAGAIAKKAETPRDIPTLIRQARLDALEI